MAENKSLITTTMKSMQTDFERIIPAQYVSDPKKYLTNTLRSIQRNPELMKYTYNKGTCIKLVLEVEKLARVGLQIGGNRPQAYIVPFRSSPVAIPTADGYKFIVTSGKNPLFKKVSLHPIYKDDKIELDEPNGIFKKKQSSGSNFNDDPKDFQGFVFVGVNHDGEKTVRKVTKNEIEQHRKFSPQKEGNIWKNHYMRMAEKTAYKHVLRDYIYLCEGLANIDELEVINNEKTIQDKKKTLDANNFSQPTKTIEPEVIEKKIEIKPKNAAAALPEIDIN
jgi:recombinational DNA repair protein RecT